MDILAPEYPRASDDQLPLLPEINQASRTPRAANGYDAAGSYRFHLQLSAIASAPNAPGECLVVLSKSQDPI